ncbi:hypothetical protein [Nocardia testacea]|uniref:hypothetical protein n=1 Tax=Nocardia testacea TaxID=248551 RepID=UPI0033F4C4CA
MRLFPFHAAHAARQRLFDSWSPDDVQAVVHDYVEARFVQPFDRWIDPDALGAYACDIRSQGATWTAISAEFNHIPRPVAMAWLLEHRLTERRACYWCRKRRWPLGSRNSSENT